MRRTRADIGMCAIIRKKVSRYAENKSKIQEKLIETRKKRANTRHPETQINDKFSFDSIDSGLIFAIISQINIQQRLKENLSDRIKSNLDTAEKNLEMVLDKYETILYDFSTDEDVLEIVRALNESRGDRESNSTSLRKKLSHIVIKYLPEWKGSRYS